jgi:Alr-MurF fusion protein
VKLYCRQLKGAYPTEPDFFNMRFSELSQIASGTLVQLVQERPLDTFLTDSRKPAISEGACFFAIAGPRHDGHQFIESLYNLGVRQFVVEKTMRWSSFPAANFFHAESAVVVLQQLAVHHRQLFHYPVIGITGSNGKTIIKEWLYQLLSPEESVVKNPGSYNSQLGVPLSVLQMQTHHSVGIFEAGISRAGEMEKLRDIIQPTIGIFSNLGSAHDEGFASRQQKANEKAALFSKAEGVIFCSDTPEIAAALAPLKVKKIAWGYRADAGIVVKISGTHLSIVYEGTDYAFDLPFKEPSFIENLVHCIVLLLHLGKSLFVIQERIRQLKTVPMRLEMKQAIGQCQLIDDSYNNDLAGLQIAINFLSAQQKKKKTLILSDILQSGLGEEELIKKVQSILSHAGLYRFIGIGAVLSKFSGQLNSMGHAQFFKSTEAFLTEISFDQFHDEVILLKGARPFQFEKIAAQLQRKIHGTVMEVDLNAMVSNLNYFKSKLKPGVKTMVMVKAFAYGSGSEEVANLLQYHKVDYLGVAYADEGVDLRKSQITLPIMVMNPTEESFDTLLAHQLEPEIYSLKILKALISFLEGRVCKIHVKVDTGMHRLGFQEDLDHAIELLKANPHIQIASMFSHLAGSDESEHDSFSQQQVVAFQGQYEKLTNELRVKPLRHVLNSPGILRFPEFQFDMVRLGIGLYGINPTENKFDGLKPVATLKSVISQIKKVSAGETVGYSRRGKALHDMKLATIAIGYADGFSRAFSRGAGVVLVNGKRAPVVGNVCMDMTMIDITGIDAEEGDEVIVFGKGLPIQEVAQRINTIAYEILTSTSERVKRVYHAESI